MRVMSADWTTCRVVRDRDGDLWGRERGGWNLITSGDTESWAPSDDFLADHYSPLTPVLDADGLPVVRTVGDLGNIHLGRRIKYEGPGGYGRDGIYQGTTADYLERDRCNMHVGGGYEAGVPLDIPCAVLA